MMDTEEVAALVDAVQDYAIFLLGPDGEIRSWNRGAGRLFGYDADEVIGRSFSIFYPPVDLAAQKPQRELAVATAEGRVEDEGWRIRKNGERFWVSTIITPLINPDGTVRGFAKVTRDLTHRRAAEEKLRRSEEMFRLLVGSVQDYAIFMLDPDGRVASWNAGAHRIKGYTADEIIGQHFSRFYSEEDRLAGRPDKEYETAIAEGRAEDEGWRVRKDGSRFWANVVLTAIRDETGTLRGFAKVTRDITDRKIAEETQRSLLQQREARLQAEDERQRAEASYRVAQEANRAKDEFLMTLSHELRTPMTAILGWSRLLPTMRRDDELFTDALRAIARGAEAQARLIDDVLDLSRIVSGKLRLRVANVEVAPVLNTALETVRQSADAKGITVTTSFSAGLGSAVLDPARLQQVIWNLLTNAVKFTPRNGTITLSARRTSSHLQITVSDTGEGIEPGFLAHVFEPFRQAESPRTRTHGGLGLGLSIVRYIAEAHGGTISAESEGKGQGATFTVTLPIAAMVSEASEAPIEQESGNLPEPSAKKPLTGVDVVLVDDDRDGRELVRASLLHAGATVTAFDNGQAALDHLLQHQPALIISDIAMPGFDGYQLARELAGRRELDRTKVLALSAFPAGPQAIQGTRFDGYLMKPIDPFALVDAISDLMQIVKP